MYKDSNVTFRKLIQNTCMYQSNLYCYHLIINHKNCTLYQYFNTMLQWIVWSQNNDKHVGKVGQTRFCVQDTGMYAIPRFLFYRVQDHHFNNIHKTVSINKAPLIPTIMKLLYIIYISTWFESQRWEVKIFVCLIRPETRKN